MVKDSLYYSGLAPSVLIQILMEAFKKGDGLAILKEIDIYDDKFKEHLKYKDVYHNSVAQVLLNQGFCSVVKDLYDLDYGVDFLKTDTAKYTFGKCIVSLIDKADLNSYLDVYDGGNSTFLEVRDLMLHCGAIKSKDEPILNAYLGHLFGDMSEMVQSITKDANGNQLDTFIVLVKSLLENKLIDVNELGFTSGFNNSVSVFNTVINYIVWLGGAEDLKTKNDDSDTFNINTFVVDKMGFLKDYVNPEKLYKNVKDHQYIAHQGSSDWADGLYNEYTHHLFTDYGFLASFRANDMGDVVTSSNMIDQFLEVFPWLLDHEIAYNKKTSAHIFERIGLTEGDEHDKSSQKSMNQITSNALLYSLLHKKIECKDINFKDKNFLNILKKELELFEGKDEVQARLFSLIEHSDLNECIVKSAVKSKALRF